MMRRTVPQGNRTHNKGKKYRGKHRSHVKGAGMRAYRRVYWMQRYKRPKR